MENKKWVSERYKDVFFAKKNLLLVNNNLSCASLKYTYMNHSVGEQKPNGYGRTILYFNYLIKLIICIDIYEPPLNLKVRT